MKKKIVYLHQYFTFPTSSGGTRSYDLSKEFVKNGYDVCFITSSAAIQDVPINKRWTYLEREGIKFFILKCPYNHNMSIRQRIASFLKFIYFVSFKLLSIKCDVVLATSTPLTIVFPALIKKLFMNTPYIFEVRDVWPEIPIKMGIIKNSFIIKLLYVFEKISYKNASWIIPLSIGMKNSILSRYNTDRITVIPNISELNRFSKPGCIKEDFFINCPDKKIIIYAGTLGPVNGLKYCVDLAHLVQEKSSDILFFIFGNGKEKKYLIEYAQEKKVINKTLFFYDSVAKDELPYLYSKSAMGSSFVIDNPVLWNNSANKFFDTLAAGKPILINHEGWQADVIHKNGIGYVLPPVLDSFDINKFIKYIMDDIKLNEQGLQARKVAEKYFSLERAVEKYKNVFEKCM